MTPSLLYLQTHPRSPWLGCLLLPFLLLLLDPLAALLLFIRPPAGLALVGAIMVSDVAHNSWILIHFSWAPDAAYWAQVFFFCFCPRRLEWPGLGPDQ